MLSHQPQAYYPKNYSVNYSIQCPLVVFWGFPNWGSPYLKLLLKWLKTCKVFPRLSFKLWDISFFLPRRRTHSFHSLYHQMTLIDNKRKFLCCQTETEREKEIPRGSPFLRQGRENRCATGWLFDSSAKGEGDKEWAKGFSAMSLGEGLVISVPSV